MNVEDARTLMKREVVKHKQGTGPANRCSLNILNSISGSVKDKSPQKELAKELTSNQL